MTDHLNQEIQLADMNDLERTLHETQNAPNRRKREIRRWVDATENLDGLAGVDSSSETHRKMLHEAAEPVYRIDREKLKQGARKIASCAGKAVFGLGLLGAIGFMAYRTYESPEEIEQRVADNIAMARLVTAADTNCDFEMSAPEFEALYERRTGQRFPQSMGYQPVVLIVSSTKQDDTITYHRMEASPYMNRPHNYLYMSRDTAISLAEDAPDHCHIPVPNIE